MNDQTPITDVLTIGVPVTDQGLALEFYTEKLGFEIRRDAPLPQPGGRWIEVAAPGARVTLALVPSADGVPAGVQTGIRLATSDAVALHADLEANAVDVDELLRWPGIPTMFALRDQDGNRLTIVEAT
jgi:catechol 2,3-dioxygenase-like lactoylglutathione lyase family enzyme